MNQADTVMEDRNFKVQMDIERQELGRAIREANYDRAASIAAYILDQLQRKRQQLQKDQ